MKAVIDANILISALLGSKRTLEILTSEKYSFYAPTKIVKEIYNNKSIVCKKASYDNMHFEYFLKAILLFVNQIEFILYEQYMAKARQAIDHRDSNDSDYIACALAVSADFIWTNDKDFNCQNLVSIKTTSDLIKGEV